MKITNKLNLIIKMTTRKERTAALKEDVKNVLEELWGAEKEDLF